MNISHRTLAGLLAVLLLIQPALALGTCCCSELPSGEAAVSDIATPAISAKCPNCRSVTTNSDQRDATQAHSEGCGCAQHREVLQANRERHRIAAVEVAWDVSWVGSPRPARPDAFQTVLPVNNPLPPRIPLQVMLCRWLA